jgi:hypothetical protein
MLKPGKTFNLDKQTKRFMCTFVDPVARNAFKRAMIDAQLCSEIVIKTQQRDKNAPRGNGPTGYQTNDTGTASTSTV